MSRSFGVSRATGSERRPRVEFEADRRGVDFQAGRERFGRDRATLFFDFSGRECFFFFDRATFLEWGADFDRAIGRETRCRELSPAILLDGREGLDGFDDRAVRCLETLG